MCDLDVDFTTIVNGQHLLINDDVGSNCGTSSQKAMMRKRFFQADVHMVNVGSYMLDTLPKKGNVYFV